MIALNIHPVLFFPAAIYSFIYVFYLSLYLAGGKWNNNIRSKRIKKHSSFSLKIVCLVVAKMNLSKKKEKVVDDWAVASVDSSSVEQQTQVFTPAGWEQPH